MHKIIVAPAAHRDFVELLVWSDEHFGAAAADRYESLIHTAFEDLADDPFRHGSQDRSAVFPGYRTYHVANSRKRAAKQASHVKNPRHIILYRVSDFSTLEIGRILHDSMDIQKHPPID